ncbi:hypothetical protein GGG16DRAFT_49671 [Schizophyllum commune]
MSSHCLSIPEIVQLICQHLNPGSLAEFARTNSSICAAALDELWSEQDSLVPLLETLPQHRVDSRRGILLEGYIPPLDWANTQAYARRVKTMDSFEMNLEDADEDGHINQDTLEIYMLRLGGAPIFPNMRNLDFVADGVAYQFLRYFMTSSLRSLRMCFRFGFLHAPRIIHILPSLPSLCPELEDLEVHNEDDPFADEDDEDDDVVVSECIIPYRDMVTGWSALTRADLAEAHHETIQHLGRCPNLRYLALDARIDLNWLPAVNPTFENGLACFSLNTRKSRFVAAILKCMSSAPIAVTRVRVTCHEENLLSKRHNLDVLAGAFDTMALRDFYYDHGPIPAGVQLMPLAALLQYTRFRNLTRFHVEAGGAIAFDDEALTEMVSAWPRLRYLSLRGIRDVDHSLDPNITLSSLSTLARLCPALRFFGCRMNTSQVPPLPDHHAVSLPDGVAPSPSITLRLEAPQSMVGDAQAMAEYICAVFKGKERFLKLDVGRPMWAPLDHEDERVLKWKKVRAFVEGWDEDRVKRGY